MPDRLAGQVTALFLYEVAEVIDLGRVATLIAPTAQARLSPKATTPSYVQYRQPPLTIDGEAIGLAEALGFRVRFKLYDYGVISVALIRPLPSSWPELIDRALIWQEDSRLGTTAETLCHDLVTRLSTAMTAPRTQFAAEDYLVVALTAVPGAETADTLLEQHGHDIVRLLRGERERHEPSGSAEEVLRTSHLLTLNAISVVPTWNDRVRLRHRLAVARRRGDPRVSSTRSCWECQLLRRNCLDRELERIYADLQRPSWSQGLVREALHAIGHQQVHAPVHRRERAHGSEPRNALKFAGESIPPLIHARRALRSGSQ
jgi:hypothetical protein